MRVSTVAQTLLYTFALVQAAPFSFPLPNGFPFPSDTALEELFTRAGGNFTNAPLAPKFDDDSLTSWKLQAFNEFMEVAFFTQLIANITDSVPGYELDVDSNYILDTLKTIQAVSSILTELVASALCPTKKKKEKKKRKKIISPPAQMTIS